MSQGTVVPIKPNDEVRLVGLPVSDGVAMARVYLMESKRNYVVPFYQITADKVGQEIARLESALQTAAAHLEELIEQVKQRVGQAQANIFVAQKLMVQDPELLIHMSATIGKDHLNAETAVAKALDLYESKLQEVDNEYLRERASDIGEIRRRLLEIMREAESADPTRLERDVVESDEPRIVVAEELTPSETVTLDAEHTVGFITERGGTASHAAILARALGIPAVSGISDAIYTFPHGERVLVNGTTGEIILRPTPATLELYPGARRAATVRVQTVQPVEGLVVMGNISLCTEAEQVSKVLGEGIGLYRTEYEFFAAGRILTEDEQYDRYLQVVRAMEGRPIYVRLLDFGSDKSARFLNLPVEENPCLGFRGARLLQGRPALLIAQARALARASVHGRIHVIYPMIIDLEQFLVLRELFRQNVADIEGHQLAHGVMFEVPSACLSAREILEVAEFGSIGSNDLIQYLFAVDRNNSLVAYDYGPNKPIFWNLLRDMAQAAKETGRALSLCGEMGGQPQYLPLLLDMGIRTVSVSPRLIGLARTMAKRWLKEDA